MTEFVVCRRRTVTRRACDFQFTDRTSVFCSVARVVSVKPCFSTNRMPRFSTLHVARVLEELQKKLSRPCIGVSCDPPQIFCRLMRGSCENAIRNHCIDWLARDPTAVCRNTCSGEGSFLWAAFMKRIVIQSALE